MTEPVQNVKRLTGLSIHLVWMLWGVVGYFLTHPPLRPDDVIPPSYAFGFMGLLVAFIFSLRAVGEFLLKRAGNWGTWAPPLLFGQLFAMVMIWPIFGLGLLGSRTSGWVLLGLFLPICIWVLRRRNRFETAQYDEGLQLFRGAILPFMLLIAIVGVRFVEALKLHAHGDAFLYHLYGPRTWFDDSGFGRFRLNWFFFHTGWFENFIQWSNILLAGEPGTALTSVQRFSQILNVIFAYCVGAMCLSRLFSLVPFARRSLIIAAGLITPTIVWGVNYVKNDWMLATWCLACVVQITRLEEAKDRRTFLILGFLLGVILISKLSNLPMVAVMGIVTVAIVPARALWVVLGGLLGVLPFVIRNRLLVGNPIFPWFDTAFGFSNLGPSSQVLMGTDMVRASFSVFDQIGYWVELFREASFSVFGLAGFLVILIRGTRRSDVLRFRVGVICFITTIWFFLQLRASTQIRYLGPVLVLWNALGVSFLFEATDRLARLWRSAVPRRSAVFGVLAVIFLFSHFPLYVLFKWGNKEHPADREAILRHRGGSAKAFMRKEIPPSDKVLSIADNQLYYVSGLSITEAVLNPDVDRKLYALTDAHELHRAVRDLGFEWLYLEVADIEPRWYQKLLAMRSFYLSTCSEGVRFNQDDLMVIDIRGCL